MPDRIEAVIAVPVDDALPPDVQGVGLRRRVIDAMKEIAEVDESTVRYKGATDTSYVKFGDNAVSMWQRNLLAARFIADGTAKSWVCGPVVHEDRDTRTHWVVSLVRNEFD